MLKYMCALIFFFFNDTATTEIYTLSLHDALPICIVGFCWGGLWAWRAACNLPSLSAAACYYGGGMTTPLEMRSEEHTSELQSQSNLVCRLLLEKKIRNRVNLMSPASRQVLIPTPS